MLVLLDTRTECDVRVAVSPVLTLTPTTALLALTPTTALLALTPTTALLALTPTAELPTPTLHATQRCVVYADRCCCCV
jgi:hypothetical protein